MPQDDAKSTSLKLVRNLDRTICNIEVFDGVLSQYFSGLNSQDILIEPPFESDSFQDFRCAS